MPCSLELTWGWIVLFLAFFMSPFFLIPAPVLVLDCAECGWRVSCASHSTVSASENPWIASLLCPRNPPGTNILGWLAISFSRGSFPPRDRAQVSCIAGRFFSICAPRDAQSAFYQHVNMHLVFWRSLEFSCVAVFSFTKFTCCVFVGPKHFHFKIFNSHKLFLFLFHAYYMYTFVEIFKK